VAANAGGALEGPCPDFLATPMMWLNLANVPAKMVFLWRKTVF